MEPKIIDAREKFDSLDDLLDPLSTFIADVNGTALPNAEDELSKSLKEIEICYSKNMTRMEKDLNRMEYRVNLIKETREKLQFKHIKSLNHVEIEVNKVLPNSLSEAEIYQEVLAGQSSIDRIREDLESDDVFHLGFDNGAANH